MTHAATSEHYRACPLCEAACGLQITHTHDEVLSIKGHAEDPVSRGHICPKAVALKDLHTDPDRLRQPMKRNGDQWQAISWSQAYAEISQKMAALQQQHGDDSLGLYIGNPNVHSHGNVLFALPLIKTLNTRNRYSAGSVDQLPLYVALYKTFGHYALLPTPDIDRCEHMICLGANPVASNGSIMSAPDIKKRLRAVSQRGQLIVIDPRYTETAELADQHLFIKPDTDVELLAGMLHILFRDGLVKTGHLSSITDGIAELQATVAPFTPQRVSRRTGIKPSQLKQLVQEFCQAEQAVLYSRLGSCTQQQSSVVQWLVLAFNLLTNNVDCAGGFMFNQGPLNLYDLSKKMQETGSYATYHAPATGLPECNGEYPVAAMPDEILGDHPERLRGLYVIAGNPAASNPNSQKVSQALAHLELLVCQDYFINETSRHAHYILPPTSPLERSCYPLISNLVGIRHAANFAEAVFKPTADSRHDWQIMLELRQQLQLAKAKNLVQKVQAKAEYQTMHRLGPDGMLNSLLLTGPYGLRKGRAALSLKKLKEHQGTVDLGPLKGQRLQGLLATADQRIKLADPDFIAELTTIAKQRATTRKNSKATANSFSLIGRRHVRSNNSWLHNSHRLVKGKNRCTVHMHPDDAAELAIEDGCRLNISTAQGQIELPAELSSNIMPGVISIPHGWGQQQAGTQLTVANQQAGANVNILSDETRLDRLSGNAAFSGQMVTVTVTTA